MMKSVTLALLLLTPAAVVANEPTDAESAYDVPPVEPPATRPSPDAPLLERIVGLWEIDHDAMRELPSYRKAFENAEGEQLAQLEEVLASIQVDLTITDSWISVVSRDGSKMTREKFSYTVERLEENMAILELKPGLTAIVEFKGEALVYDLGKPLAFKPRLNPLQ